MVLADAVHQDPGTGKFTILGTFHGIHVGEFPTPVQFSVYFAVTDWLGKGILRVQLVDDLQHLADEGSGPLFAAEIDTENYDPLEVLEAVVRVTADIEHEGAYFCELYADEAPTISRRVVINGPDSE